MPTDAKRTTTERQEMEGREFTPDEVERFLKKLETLIETSLPEPWMEGSRAERASARRDHLKDQTFRQ